MVLAASEGTGAVSWLSYAFRVMYLPIGLFGVSVAAAAVPLLSRHGAQKDVGGMRDTVSRALRLTLAINLPATVGLMVLGVPIVEVIFERGAFTAADTSATAAALLLYAPGLAGYAAVRIAVPCFYALGSSRTPAAISVAAVTLNIGLNLVLVRVLGYRGLALGTSVAALVNALALLVVLRRRLDGLDLRRVLTLIGKVLVASTAMGAAAWMAHDLLLDLWDGAGLAVRSGRLAASIAAALAVLLLSARLLRLRELDEALGLVAGRLRRR